MDFPSLNNWMGLRTRGWDDTALRQISEFLATPLFRIQKTEVTLASVLGAVLLVCGAFVLSRLLGRMLRLRVLPNFKIEEGLQYTLLRLVHYLWMALGVVLGLQFLGVNLSTLAVLAGLLGVGVGFGLQNVVANFVAGFILLFERPISVGDRISLGDIHGDVQHIYMRSTTIRTPDNIAIIVPNSDLINGRITNWSYEDPRVRFHLAIEVAHSVDVNRVRQLLLQVADAHGSVLKQPAPEVLFCAISGMSLCFELLIWVADPKIGGLVLSDLYYHVLPLFKEHGIELPPRREIYVRQAGPDAASS
jgi:small-conductance mechanosensitive channel